MDIMGAAGSSSGCFGTVDVVSPLTNCMLGGASALCREAFAIEALDPTSVTQEQKVAHMGFVIGAIVETATALEAQSWEVLAWGPGHHRGTQPEYQSEREMLSPMADVVEKQPILERYAIILHLLGRESMDTSAQPWQDAALLVRLRNGLVHYKARPGRELARQKLIRALMDQRLSDPPFYDPNLAFFPHRCLSASRASWAVEAGLAFLDSFSELLGGGNPREMFADWMRPRPDGHCLTRTAT